MSIKVRKETEQEHRSAKKEQWKNRPGHRYTPAQLKAMLQGPLVKIHTRKMVCMRYVK